MSAFLFSNYFIFDKALEKTMVESTISISI